MSIYVYYRSQEILTAAASQLLTTLLEHFAKRQHCQLELRQKLDDPLTIMEIYHGIAVQNNANFCRELDAYWQEHISSNTQLSPILGGGVKRHYEIFKPLIIRT